MHNEGVKCTVNECAYHVECDKCKLQKIEVTHEKTGADFFLSRKRKHSFGKARYRLWKNCALTVFENDCIRNQKMLYCTE